MWVAVVVVASAFAEVGFVAAGIVVVAAAAGVDAGAGAFVVFGVVVERRGLEIPVRARVGIGAVFSGQVLVLAFWWCCFSRVVFVPAVVFRAQVHTRTARVVP